MGAKNISWENIPIRLDLMSDQNKTTNGRENVLRPYLKKMLDPVGFISEFYQTFKESDRFCLKSQIKTAAFQCSLEQDGMSACCY